MAGSAASFTWTVAPSQHVIPELSSYEERVIQGMFLVADMFTAQLEAAAKHGAPWNDRTGAARQGLRATARRAAMEVTLSLMHSVFYGVYLELGTRYMAPRPIILPTLEAHYGPIMAALRALVGG